MTAGCKHHWPRLRLSYETAQQHFSVFKDKIKVTAPFKINQHNFVKGVTFVTSNPKITISHGMFPLSFAKHVFVYDFDVMVMLRTCFTFVFVRKS